MGEHGYFGDLGQEDVPHGEAENISLEDYVDSSVNTINAPDFVATFAQGDSVNTLFGSIDEGRVAWMNGNEPSHSTAFEPRDGVVSYLSDQFDQKGPANVLLDDLGISEHDVEVSDTPSIDVTDHDGVDASDL